MPDDSTDNRAPAQTPLPYGRHSSAYIATQPFYRNPRTMAVVSLACMAMLPVLAIEVDYLFGSFMNISMFMLTLLAAWLTLMNIAADCRAKLRRSRTRIWARPEFTTTLGILWMGLAVGSVFLFSYNGSNNTSPRLKSRANLHSMGQSIVQYTDDNQEHLPDTIEQLMIAEQLPPEILICPATKDTPIAGKLTAIQMHAALAAGGHDSYVYVGKGMTGANPGNSVVFYEPLSNFAGAGGNVLLLDGSVAWYPASTLSIIIKQINAGQNPPPVLGPPTGPPSWRSMLSAPSTAPAAAPATHPSTAPARAP